MSQSRLCLAFLAFLVLASPPVAPASDFNQYKDLRNPFLRVTNIEERQRTEERYAETGGKVALQKQPYKEVVITAVLTQKPPSSLDAMFETSNPYFKVCLQPFDTAGQAMDDDCKSFHFQSMVKGNVGTSTFRLAPEVSRYEVHVAQKIPDKGSAIKLWNPNAQ
jgi:hypothetical protein